jgi:sugar lactone lactonase YvrE
MEFVWDSAAEKQDALDSGAYIPENCPMTGLKVCGPAVSDRCKTEQVFVTIPRWKLGVPSTLNMVVLGKDNQPFLWPWPSKKMQDINSCDNLQFVQSMEIDPEGVMWVLDVGRKHFVEKDPNLANNTCPPKMVLIDVPTGTVVDTYVFPTEDAPHDGAYLNDLVIDVPRQIAYISSTGNNASDLGSILVYDRNRRKSRRFEDKSTHAEQGADIRIHGVVQSELQDFPCDSIALAPDRNLLYYAPLGGFHLYSVETEMLRDFAKTSAEVSATVVDYGERPSNADGMTFSQNGTLWLGGLTTDSLYSWNPGEGPVSDAMVVKTDAERLWWIDTFAWDETGSIWMTSNRLNVWFFGSPDYSQTNYRILKADVGAFSYMHGQTPPPQDTFQV